MKTDFEDDSQNKSNTNNSNNIETNKVDFTPEILKYPEDFSGFDLKYKIIIIGRSGVGKSCITNQAVHEEFLKDYKVTIGMEFYVIFVKINDKIIKLQIWDTCGQEAYKSLIANFYRSVSLAFIVYGIDSRESFEDIDYWIKDLKIYNSPDTKLILIGNKCDLESGREVSKEEANKYAETYQFLNFFETSAKTGANIKEMFLDAAKILYNENLKYSVDESNANEVNAKIISDENQQRRKNTGCC